MAKCEKKHRTNPEKKKSKKWMRETKRQQNKRKRNMEVGKIKEREKRWMKVNGSFKWEGNEREMRGKCEW